MQAEGWFPPNTGDHDAVLPSREGLIQASPKLMAAGLLNFDEQIIRDGTLRVELVGDVPALPADTRVGATRGG